jgi:DNA ligase D-like protein (predicted polymerase)/DNA ligase D-like protein (predicted 3'-phosphoesterase)
VSLKTYREKRDFSKTREPKGLAAKAREKAIFVIHEHHASVLHFDLRLEIGGALKSWSVPKGPTLDPDVKRLAVEVEDHPLEYANFNGVIPEGQYGAGKSLIWDKGQVVFDEQDPIAAWDEGRISFSLKGEKLKGDFALVEMKGRKGKPQWLLMKKKDEYADPEWRLKLVEPDRRFKPAEKSSGAGPTAKAAGKTTKLKKKPVQREKPEKMESIAAAAFLRRKTLEGSLDLKVGKNKIALTHLEKLYWPREKISKGDLLQYYLQIGETITPHLKGRPAVLKRFPNGIDEEGFFQHNTPSGPAYLKRASIESVGGRMLEYAVYTDLASLLYLVNLGVIAQHAWLSRIDKLDRPDYVVFDLDPKEAPFGNVLKVAGLMKQTLDEMGLQGFAKTSGSSGVHIFVPIKRQYSFEQAMEWAERTAKDAAARNPKIATIERRLSGREKSQVYIDWQQNARGKTIASAYTARDKPKAAVSAPVTWKEIEAGFKMTDFTIKTMPERLRKIGDLWESLLETRQSLPTI